VHMPHFAQFKDPASHAGTLIHEHGHNAVIRIMLHGAAKSQ
jgi:antirestriction protein ArdC